MILQKYMLFLKRFEILKTSTVPMKSNDIPYMLNSPFLNIFYAFVSDIVTTEFVAQWKKHVVMLLDLFFLNWTTSQSTLSVEKSHYSDKRADIHTDRLAENEWMFSCSDGTLLDSRLSTWLGGTLCDWYARGSSQPSNMWHHDMDCMHQKSISNCPSIAHEKQVLI